MPVKSSGNRGPPEGRCQASRGVVHGPAFGLAFGFKDVKRDFPATAQVERSSVSSGSAIKDRAYFKRPLIFCSPATAQALSFSLPLAPPTPIAPITSSPTFKSTPPARLL